MRRYMLALALVAVLGIQSASAVVYVAFEQIAVAGTAVGFTATKITPAGQPAATIASCRVRTNEISYTVDGTTPTATVGTIASVNDVLTIVGHDLLVNFQAIRTGSSGQLDCDYFTP